jgi:hypothetical protein
MGNIFDVMLEFFREDDWKFYQMSDQTILRLNVSGRNGNGYVTRMLMKKGSIFLFIRLVRLRFLNLKESQFPNF